MPRGLRKPILRPSQAVVLSFVAVALAGWAALSLPLAAEQQALTPLDALFTSVSAVCVTGLSTINVGAQMSTAGHLILLVLIQIGGLGYMVLSTAVLLLLGHQLHLGRRILLQTAVGSTTLRGSVGLFRAMLGFTFTAEALGAVALAVVFRWRYDMAVDDSVMLGIFHAVSAFCNAGFDLFGRSEFGMVSRTGSLEAFQGDPLVLGIVAALIVVGGIGFVVLLDMRYQPEGRQRLSLHSKIVLWATLILVLGPSVLYFALEYANPATLGPMPLGDKIANALFQGITPRTAGFSAIGQGDLYPASKILTMYLMFIGASPGGTGGGVKTTTFVIVMLAAWASVRGDEDVALFGRRIGHGTVYRALAVIIAGFLVLALASPLLAVFESQTLLHTGPAAVSERTFMDFFFEVTSAFGTVGLSTGVTADLTPGSKLVIMMTMLLGRVGPVTFAVALAERQRRRFGKFPEGTVLIG